MNLENFKTELDNIFPTERTLKIVLGEDKNVKSAKVNTSKPLSLSQVSKVLELANHSKLKFNIKRSGAGLKVEFN